MLLSHQTNDEYQIPRGKCKSSGHKEIRRWRTNLTEEVFTESSAQNIEEDEDDYFLYPAVDAPPPYMCSKRLGTNEEKGAKLKDLPTANIAAPALECVKLEWRRLLQPQAILSDPTRSCSKMQPEM